MIDLMAGTGIIRTDDLARTRATLPARFAAATKRTCGPCRMAYNRARRAA